MVLNYNEVVTGTHCDDETKEKEKEFHLSRLMWAIVNDEVQYTFSELDHIRWLSTEYDVNEQDFEQIVRGYIRENEDSSLNLIFYKGIRHSPTVIYKTHLQRLINIAKSITDWKGKEIHVYSGVEIGEIGQVWKPIKHIMDVN